MQLCFVGFDSCCPSVQYTLEELKDRVQASDAELLESLEQQQACSVDGEVQ